MKDIQPGSPEAMRAARKLLHGFLVLAGLNVILIIYVFFFSEKQPPQPVPAPPPAAPAK